MNKKKGNNYIYMKYLKEESNSNKKDIEDLNKKNKKDSNKKDIEDLNKKDKEVSIKKDIVPNKNKIYSNNNKYKIEDILKLIED